MTPLNEQIPSPEFTRQNTAQDIIEVSTKPALDHPRPLLIADSKDNLHDPFTLQFSELYNKNLFGFSRHPSHSEGSFFSDGKFGSV